MTPEIKVTADDRELGMTAAEIIEALRLADPASRPKVTSGFKRQIRAMTFESKSTSE